MKRIKVEIPFHLIATNTDHVPGDIIKVSEDQLAKIRSVNINMVSVLGDVEEPVQEVAAKPKTRKPKKQ